MATKEPVRNRYVGHRYVPLILGEWDQAVAYEGLSVVLHQGNSYTSTGKVPVGIPISDEKFWKVTGNYNVQIEQYRHDVKRNSEQVEAYKEETDGRLDALDNYTIRLYKPHFKFDGSDETAKVQAILDQYTGWENRVTLEFPSNEKIYLQGLEYNGRLSIKGNYSTIIGNTGFFLKNKAGSGAHLWVEDLNLSKIGLADFQMPEGISSGLRVKAKNITGDGSDALNPLTIFYRGRSNDFLDFQNVSLYHYAECFTFLYTVGQDRMTTQLSFKNIDIHYSKQGFFFRGIDKATLDNIDLQRVGTGVVFSQYCRRMHFRTFHVERYGHYTGYGYGIKVDNVNQNIGIVFETSDITLPADHAIMAIEIPQITASIPMDFVAAYKFNDMIADKINGLPSVRLNGNFEWNSEVVDGLLDMYGSLNRLLTGKINPVHSDYRYHKNLLAVSEITSLSNFVVPAGSAAVMVDEGFMKKITNNGTENTTVDISFTPKEVGYYSLLFNGAFIGNDGLIRVQQSGSPYLTFITSKCNNGSRNKTNRLFFNVTDITRDVLIRFTIPPNESLYINSIGAYRGFKNEF